MSALAPYDTARIAALFAQRRPGHTLPQALYRDADVFAFDMEAIYGANWLVAGFECELPGPGSTLAQMIGPWPILLTRDKAGTIRGFHNSCRHRGSVLCQPGHAQSPRLVCPYHRWTYDLEGALLAAPRMPEGFDKRSHGLKPITVECAGGLIFVCLSDTPPPFGEFAARLETYLAPHHVREGKLAAEDMLVEYANWKLVMENGRECYHCATGHPELAKTFPVQMSKHFDTENDRLAADYVEEMKAFDLVTEAVEGDWWQLARFGLNPGVASLTMDGSHASKKLMCDINGGMIGSMRLAVDPHCFVHATADQVFLFSAMPVSPTETHVTAKWVVHKDAVERVDYDRSALMELWTVTNLQDKELAENNQTGVNSPGYTPGPYSPDAEMLAQRFTDWYCTTAERFLGVTPPQVAVRAA